MCDDGKGFEVESQIDRGDWMDNNVCILILLAAYAIFAEIVENCIKSK